MSDLRIGFANKYFTLWSVSTEDCYSTAANGQHYKSHTKTNYYYYQNLSIDEATAIEKAKAKGCTMLTPDVDLRGKTSSWSSVERYDEPSEDWEFKRGRYRGQDIRTCEDLDFLSWYYRDQNCNYAMNRIAEIDPNFSIVKGELVHKDTVAKRKVIKRIKAGKYELTAVSNFTPNPDGTAEVKVTIEPKTEAEYLLCEANPYGIRIEVLVDELDLQRREYRGYDYYVPAGMRSFKGKTFKLDNNNLIF